MKKVGIMSMQRIINYGSFLQAYGLKKVIEGLGYEVEFVDYQVEKTLISDKKRSKKERVLKKLQSAVKMFSPQYRRWRKKQIRLNETYSDFITAFQEEFFPMLGISNEPQYLLKTDVLVIGSDEVFNCTQMNDKVGYSKQLFGKGCKAEKIISYAASFGNTTYEKLIKFGVDVEIGEMLSKFDAISVRDRNTYKIVNELTGIISNKNIDPVLLYSFPEVDEVKIEQKDYIVVYAYANRITEEEIKAIRIFAAEKKKKILSLGFYQPFCDEWVLASPLEVLAYIKNAEYVITDTFHGTVYSIKYQKKFGTIIRESNKEKISDVLNTFGLESRKITELDNLCNVVDAPIDKKKIFLTIQDEHDRAMKYLTYNL